MSLCSCGNFLLPSGILVFSADGGSCLPFIALPVSTLLKQTTSLYLICCSIVSFLDAPFLSSRSQLPEVAVFSKLFSLRIGQLLSFAPVQVNFSELQFRERFVNLFFLRYRMLPYFCSSPFPGRICGVFVVVFSFDESC